MTNNKMAIAEKRYEEMESRKADFMKDYKETGNELSLELANVEQDSMNKLMESMMKAKRNNN